MKYVQISNNRVSRYKRKICEWHSGFTPTERPIRMDPELWFRDWAVMHEGFPDDYLVLDIETTGSDLEKDIIFELGWCEIRDNKIKSNNSAIIDYAHSRHVDPNFVKSRFKETKQKMEAEGKSFPFSVDSLKYGVDPTLIFQLLLNKLLEIRYANGVVVTHNGVRFDLPIITNHIKRILNKKHIFLRS